MATIYRGYQSYNILWLQYIVGTKATINVIGGLYHCAGVGEGSEGALEHHNTILVQCEGDRLHWLQGESYS